MEATGRDGPDTGPAVPLYPRRARVAESVYQRIDRDTGQPISGKFEFTYRDSAGRQRWQTAKSDTKADAKAERAEMVARLYRGERVERSSRTVGEVAEAWLERARGKNGPWDGPTKQRYERIVRQQVLASVDEARRPLGGMKLRDVTVDHVAGWSQGNEQALAPSTAKLALIALNQIFRFAVRRGWLSINPVMQLEPGEKPRWRVKHVRILEGADLAKLLDHADAWRVLFEFLAYTGLRIGEALGVRWCEVDFEAGLLHVRQQLSRHRTLKHLKTDAGRRDVVLAPAVVRLLRERWLASPYKTADHLVFCKASGEPGDYRDAGEGFRAAVKAAGLQGQGRLSLHSLRHGFASLLIAKKLNPVFVSRQLGHSNPAITFRVYAHLFEHADSAAAAREALEASYVAMAGSKD